MSPEIQQAIRASREALGRMYGAVAEVQQAEVEVRYAAWRLRAELRHLRTRRDR